MNFIYTIQYLYYLNIKSQQTDHNILVSKAHRSAPEKGSRFANLSPFFGVLVFNLSAQLCYIPISIWRCWA